MRTHGAICIRMQILHICKICTRMQIAPCVQALCICVSVNIFKLEYLRNQWANRNQFYLKHHLGALGFRPDRIGTLVSMATDSAHRFIMEEML